MRNSNKIFLSLLFMLIISYFINVFLNNSPITTSTNTTVNYNNNYVNKKVPLVIVFNSLLSPSSSNDNNNMNPSISSLGGTGHWYHLLQLIIKDIDSSINIWRCLNSNSSSSNCSSINDKYNIDTSHVIILFHEEVSLVSLNAFGRLLIASTFIHEITPNTNTIKKKVKKISFGVVSRLNKKIINNNNNNSNIDSIIELVDLKLMFTTELSQQDFLDRFLVSTTITSTTFSSLYGYELVRVSNNRLTHKQKWFNSMNSWKLFRNSAMTLCDCNNNSNYDNRISSKRVSESIKMKDDSDLINHKIYKSDSNNDTFIEEKVIPTTSNSIYNISLKSKPKILIYNRDQSRKIKYLDNNMTIDENKNKNKHLKNSQDLLKLQSLFQKSLGNKWDIDILTHNNNYSPCLLLKSIINSKILISSHGFQSILLLFQPSDSLFVEIFPYQYLKPSIYGKIQMNINQILKKNYNNNSIYRSYLAFESSLYTTHSNNNNNNIKSILSSLPLVLQHHLRKKLINIATTCGSSYHQQLHSYYINSKSNSNNMKIDHKSFSYKYYYYYYSALCRNILRSQDVYINNNFIKKTSKFIKSHYIVPTTITTS